MKGGAGRVRDFRRGASYSTELQQKIAVALAKRQQCARGRPDRSPARIIDPSRSWLGGDVADGERDHGGSCSRRKLSSRPRPRLSRRIDEPHTENIRGVVQQLRATLERVDEVSVGQVGMDFGTPGYAERLPRRRRLVRAPDLEIAGFMRITLRIAVSGDLHMNVGGADRGRVRAGLVDRWTRWSCRGRTLPSEYISGYDYSQSIANDHVHCHLPATTKTLHSKNAELSSVFVHLLNKLN